MVLKLWKTNKTNKTNKKALWHRLRIFIYALLRVTLQLDFSVSVMLKETCALKAKYNCIMQQVFCL